MGIWKEFVGVFLYDYWTVLEAMHLFPEVRCEWEGSEYEQLREDIRVTTYLESPWTVRALTSLLPIYISLLAKMDLVQLAVKQMFAVS